MERHDGNNTTISNDQLDKSFVFVLSNVDVDGELPIEIAPNHFFQRANVQQIKKIKRLINLCKPSLQPYPLPILYELDIIKETGDKPGSFRYQHKRLPEDKWRYWIITFEGTNSEINYIESATSLLHNDLELGFTIFGKSSLVAGEAYIWHGQSLFSFFDSGEEKKPAELVTENELLEISENYDLVKNISPDHEYIARTLRKFNDLKSLPRNSELIIIVLFSIIESLITHCPSNKNIDDSINHQIYTKIPLLSKRFPRKLDCTKYFGKTKEEDTWKKLYKYRNSIVHGEYPSLAGSLKKVLKDRETVYVFLKETVKLLLLFALKEPIFLTDLKKC